MIFSTKNYRVNHELISQGGQKIVVFQLNILDH